LLHSCQSNPPTRRINLFLDDAVPVHSIPATPFPHTTTSTVELYKLGTAQRYWELVHENVFSDGAHWQSYPPYVLYYRSSAFMAIIMAVAETCGRFFPYLQPRGVPGVITSAVVISGLLIILSDWGFSQVLLKYGLE